MSGPNYIFKKEIGKGAFGKVYKGVHTVTNQEVAIKRLLKSKMNAYLLKQLELELYCMKLCDCENSVRFLERFETQSNFNIILELCDGDFFSIYTAHKGGFSADEIYYIFSQLNTVFHRLNEFNIIHRDLKLQNILFKWVDDKHEKFIPKLADYGFSKTVADGDTATTHLGTPLTMAPEVIMNQPYNKQADLWSIGIILYQLHFKKYPFMGRDDRMILQKIKTTLHQIEHANDPLLDDLIRKLLVIDPKQRYTWDQYFKHPFFTTRQKEEQKQIEEVNRTIIMEKKKEKEANLKEINLNAIEQIKTNFNTNDYTIFKAMYKGKKVIVKKFSKKFTDLHEKEFEKEKNLCEIFKNNENCIKFVDSVEEPKYHCLIFEDVDFDFMLNYSKANALKEEDIKKINKELYENFLGFLEAKNIDFNIITIHSFIYDKKQKKVKFFDYGFHHLLLPPEEQEKYFMSEPLESGETEDSYRTNVMNYAYTLIQMLNKGELNITITKGNIDKIQGSPEMNEFFGKCLYKNIHKRYTWNDFGNDKWVNTDANLANANNVLLSDDKVKKILDFYTEKSETIIKYFEKIDMKDDMTFIKEFEYFLILKYFELKKVIEVFTKNVYKSEDEITFVNIFSDKDKDTQNLFKDFSLNLTVPKLMKMKLCNYKDLNSNIDKLKESLKKIQQLYIRAHGLSKSDVQNYKTVSAFIKHMIISWHSLKFSDLVKTMVGKATDFRTMNKNEEAFLVFSLTSYLIQDIIIVKYLTIPGLKKKIVDFTKESLSKRIESIFSEKTEEVKANNVQYTYFSFIGVLFRTYKNAILKEKGKSAIQGDSPVIISTLNSLAGIYPMTFNYIKNLKETM